VILGQGLAGSCLAWACEHRGISTFIISEAGGASRIAAGLITPLTGKAFAPTRDLPRLWSTAKRFYSLIEHELASPLLHPREVARIFASEAERELFSSKPRADRDPWLTPFPPELDSQTYRAPHGVIGMSPAGQLDVRRLLDGTRQAWATRQRFVSEAACYSEDVHVTPQGVRLPRFGVMAEFLVDCRGVAGLQEPWLPKKLHPRPARGEILTVRIPGLLERRIINHAGHWLAPAFLADEHLYRTGATYDQRNLDPLPTAAGRAEIEANLQAFLRVPYEVVHHEAAVRPILAGQLPEVVSHPESDRVIWVNGLASKGALFAPAVAERVAEELSRRAQAG
jgi:glycine/D-amino acid oxidase-like deaminating enzyme